MSTLNFHKKKMLNFREHKKALLHSIVVNSYNLTYLLKNGILI